VTTFGYEIALARVSKGLSQRAVAEAIGFSQPYLSALECGKGIPSEAVLQKLATVLDLPVDWLYFKLGHIPYDILRQDPPKERVVRTMRRLRLVGSEVALDLILTKDEIERLTARLRQP